MVKYKILHSYIDYLLLLPLLDTKFIIKYAIYLKYIKFVNS